MSSMTQAYQSLTLAALALALTAAPALADSVYVDDGPNANPTSFTRPYIGIGNVITIEVREDNNAESGALTDRSKDSRVRGEWDFGSLVPTIAKSAFEMRGRDDFEGKGTTSRNGQLRMDVSCRIEEVLPNGTLRVVGHKNIRVNDEETEITVKGIIRPMDITPDNRVESRRVADMSIDFKGTGPATAKATPGALTRVFNWLF
jgi:flagellar L-ring protein precursor FlgH